ncbi:hypothetical protein MNKW57_20590 [Biformimicrobium ophioploci]|uniref:Uncharacterized protein n=1 Tax=Biformimicrobium ophioploci TaxID=3036711 RepID=A0ABQ6M060_9GAMM|nr:hypothetical protein MNKW57_20590 [Microbulbifer sp. NKW57]
MCVSRQYCDEFVLQQLYGTQPGGLAKLAGYRASGHLKKAAELRQGKDLVEIPNYIPVTLRMSNHWSDAMLQKPAHKLLNTHGYVAVWQFKQQNPFTFPVAEQR